MGGVSYSMENYLIISKHNKSLLLPPTSVMGPTVILLVESIIHMI
jgi:hypothetical protein